MGSGWKECPMTKKQKKKIHHSRPHNDSVCSSNYRAANRQAVQDVSIQFAMDCACIVLHDEFGFGAERLRKFHDLQNKEMLEWWEATSDSDEAGYHRHKMDEKLRAAGVLDEPFEKRYEWIKFRI